jgi:16S rRNA (adenine1518-N6/adenine1519-N6)-dimethyltransferase
MNLIEGDALRVRLPRDLSAVVANIPFQISSPLIDRLAQHQRQYSGINSIVLLLQEEFAARLCMSEGVSSRGSLGMTTAMEWNAELDIKVHSHAFKPAPKVHSRLVHLTPNNPISKMEEGIPRPEPRLARLVVSTAFKERRKKMRNRLRQAPKHISRVKGWHASGYREAAKALLEKPDRMGLPLGWQEARPEQLDLQTWLTVAGWLQWIHDEKDPVY